jgi:YfiH family protein
MPMTRSDRRERRATQLGAKRTRPGRGLRIVVLQAMSRREKPDGSIAVYRSDLIDESIFTHGFPERHGGLSMDARSSLNLGYRWGDSKELVEDNRRLVAEHVGFGYDQLVVTKHVHGVNVWRVGEPLPDPPEFDGLVSDRPGVVLGAFAADCVPIVFADAVAKVCGAAHAGWRGTVNGAQANVIKRMVEAGANTDNIRVSLGPSIAACCFEVGDEVVEEFQAKLGDVEGMIVEGPNKRHIDLRIANREQLVRAGVRASHVDINPPCTKCNPNRFFSYRRDGQNGGVHKGFIGLRTKKALVCRHPRRTNVRAP